VRLAHGQKDLVTVFCRLKKILSFPIIINYALNPIKNGSELKSGSIWPQRGCKEDKFIAFSAYGYPNPVTDKAGIRLNL